MQFLLQSFKFHDEADLKVIIFTLIEKYDGQQSISCMKTGIFHFDRRKNQF